MELSKRLKPKDMVLLLEDGLEFDGWSIGPINSGYGEVVFNTAMSGYQEVLTDPSYTKQLVVMTYPQQGNYGINDKDNESVGGPKVGGFLVHEFTEPSNFESKKSLKSYLIEHSIPAMEGVDTRALTLHVRSRGALRGLIMTKEYRSQLGTRWGEEFSRKPLFVGIDLMSEASTKKAYWYSTSGSKTVVTVDFGVKTNLLRELASRNLKVAVVPAKATYREIMDLKPDGVFLSNGPGDPSTATYAIETVKELLGKLPVFGVCMGHQILSLALGGKTYKMKFGHRGINQPVLNAQTKQVEVSSHNHGFAVDASSLPASVEVTHINLNDQTCEGIEAKQLKAFSVQYHPESAPGPHDSAYLFDRFAHMIYS